jgi:hypothetical protein
LSTASKNRNDSDHFLQGAATLFSSLFIVKDFPKEQSSNVYAMPESCFGILDNLFIIFCFYVRRQSKG